MNKRVEIKKVMRRKCEVKIEDGNFRFVKGR
jgi:hypothetical protein